ncbi:MAG: hypothetical protein JO307_08060 [Bryobacterales bacterium]|nr:hypothetical protein [Bryobacterales bacterium]MBV9400398.1 hypothetical protein [Bryobacterales bacterium]
MPKLAAACLAFLFPAFGQWLHYPTPGIPRTADGKPDLRAAAPKTTDGKFDISGLWKAPNGKYLFNLAADLTPDEAPFQPWAAALYKARQDNLAKDRPSSHCLPHGVPDQMAVAGYPFKIIQTPGLILILYEEMSHYRQIFTDGRPLPQDPNPALVGYSVGRWEKDELVVETTGFSETSWLDDPGHPHTDALRVTERFRRPDFGRLEARITIDDPKTYTRPWTVTENFDFVPDTDIIEHVCENEKDAAHLVGK